MKNIQPYIIAGMTILIVVLSWFLYNSTTNVDVYKRQIELNELKKQKTNVEKQSDSILIDVSKKSTKTVEKAKLIIKKIKYETPIVKDTTDAYMYEYIVNYCPAGQC